MPEVFQKRIRKFREVPNFREDLEGYEIMACELAVIIAERLGTVEGVEHWRDLDDYAERLALVPEAEVLDSNLSFYASCYFAQVYLTRPELLLELPGAMAPLAGTEAYLPRPPKVEQTA